MTFNDEGRSWVRPKFFHGDMNEDPVEWVEELDNIRRVNRWTDETVIDMVGYYCRDEASTWFRTNETKFTTYRELKESFLSKFRTERRIERWRQELECRRQKPNETVGKLVHSVQKLIDRVGVTDEKEKVRYLLRALKPAYQTNIRRGRPATFEEVVELAQVEEMAFDQGDFDASPVKSSRRQANQDAFERGGAKRMENTTTVPNPGYIEQGNATQPPSVDEKIGMLVDEFRKLKINLLNGSRRQGPKICYACQQEGHIRRNCPYNNMSGRTAMQEVSEGSGKV
ncbi:uncharacterized protein VTP21DRAFT_1506 [Calcarisporiella thermophila]|uniref:uncharacterized protein n=1 Tax=Calcarisporiella thermophila TaxID=911321 RepID=UPI003742FA51